MFKISIIIPIYNVEPFILHCLRSVANQTVSSGIECVLVDDCGNDNSVGIAEKFIKEYKGEIVFRVIHHQSNRGLSAARNTGIRVAKGDYVYFLDSDDAIISECMEDFLNIIARHPNVDLLQGFIEQDSAYMNQFAERKLPDFTDDRRFIKRALLDYDMLPVCAANKMVRRQLIIDNGLFFKEGIIHEDNHWSFFLSKYVKSLAVNKKKCYLYTENPQSITKDIDIVKETQSAHIIIEDYCNNIDSYMIGEQKTAIFKFICLSIDKYKEDNEKNTIMNTFMKVCNYGERILLRLWLDLKDNSIYKHFLSRIIIANFKMANK